MASGPISSWQREWGKSGSSDRIYFLTDGDCSHEIKRCLLLGRKAMTNLNGVLKSRDISLLTKVHIVRAMIFPVVMYGLESWTIKKAEHQRIDAFELWYWKGLLRVPWTSRKSNQSILKDINPEYSLEGLMLKLQYFGHLMWRADSLEKTLGSWKIEGRRRSGWQRMRWLDGITDSMTLSKMVANFLVHGSTFKSKYGWTLPNSMSSSKLWEMVKDREAWCATVHGFTGSQTGLNNWTTLSKRCITL